LPVLSIDIEKAAKHLTTSARMLTAAMAIGKLQSRADPFEHPIDSSVW